MKLQVKIDDQTLEVEIEDLSSRPIVVNVQGEMIEVWPEETAASTAVSAPAVAQTQAPAAPAPTRVSPSPVAGAANSASAVLAPLPGTIVGITVREGQSVKRGEELLTLEAMKMKNSIRAGRDGKVGTIHVKVGDQVRHNQILLEYAD
ncbi:MAG: biotin/lipoyl-containing protein [Bellilinea sp.]